MDSIYPFSVIFDFIKGIKFYSSNEKNRKMKYFFQVISHLIALLHLVIIAYSLFAIIASFIIFILQIDLKEIINDTLLVKILMFYAFFVIIVSSAISIRNTFLNMNHISIKKNYESYLWIFYLLFYIVFALVFLIIGII